MSDDVVAQVILRSADGSSVSDPDEPITSETVDSHRVESHVIERAKEALRDLGFEVVQASEVGLSISGDKERFEEVFDTTLKARPGSTDADTSRGQVYEATAPVQIPEELSSLVDDVAFPVSPEFH
ncbi:hypothetical protein [Salinibacter altiplanensis]|uniref:hypothetical protein n=1 Tax=Salinibacter altiplanensis TaxID=1803181 RepID=UPI000C9F79FA|nr:hypothetical protein [Salinibacter altiplanensis]